MSEPAPETVVALARARAEARARRDWTDADRLRAEIDAAGWKVVDAGTSFILEPAHPADVEVDGRIRYGRSASVPSRLQEPEAGAATVVLLAGDDLGRLSASVAALGRHLPAGTSVVVVADGPPTAVESAMRDLAPAGGGGLAGPGPETAAANDPPSATAADERTITVEGITTSERLGTAAAANAGIRRALGHVVILLRATSEVSGDVVTPLVHSLADPSVGVAGGTGLTTRDLRHVETAAPSVAVAVGLDGLAFRRSDYVARGPLDEGLRTDEYLALWWSLVLRDEGDGRAARQAVVAEGLPLGDRRSGEEAAGPSADAGAGRERSERRDYYRVLERFRGRDDLLAGHP